MLKTLFSKLSADYKASYINYDALMKDYSSMHTGGRPAALITIDNYYDLLKTLEFFSAAEFKLLFIGKATNIIFGDNLKNYVIIMFGDSFNKITVENNIMRCGAATPFQQAVRKSAEFGLSGLEWAMGIPGVIAGAAVNNCGGSANIISDIISDLTVIDYSGKKKILKIQDINPAYRMTDIKKNRKYIVTDVTLKLEKKDRLEVLDSLNKNFMKKQSTQPLNEFSAGCIFKNPAACSAGKLIDECGLKGYSVGGAKISEKHANFIVNNNHALFADIKHLIDYIRDNVARKFNIELELEVEIIGG